MAAMATTGSSRRSPNGPVLRSLSPGRLNYFSTSPSSGSTSFASSSSSFAARSSAFFRRHHHDHHQLQRSTSPSRVNLYGNAPSVPSVRFSLDRPISPNRSISAVSPSRSHHHHRYQHHQVLRKENTPKRTCLCSPTRHPGSFRCSLHKGFNNSQSVNYSPNNRLNARRSAMTNSLVRIRGVEGDLVKRALVALIRPSSHQQRRRTDFQPRLSRLSVMSRAEDS